MVDVVVVEETKGWGPAVGGSGLEGKPGRCNVCHCGCSGGVFLERMSMELWECDGEMYVKLQRITMMMVMIKRREGWLRNAELS